MHKILNTFDAIWSCGTMVNCPKCGMEMRYIDRYERWYCDFCKEYAPVGYDSQSSVSTSNSKPVIPSCHKCGQPLTYIKEYDRWYCYTCKEYAPKDVAPALTTHVQGAQPAISAPMSQTASQPAAAPAAGSVAPARPAVRVPSHSHAGNPAAGGWVMLLGFLLVLTDELVYILRATGSITLNPPMIGGSGGWGLLVYGGGMGGLLGISGLLIFMLGGIMTALAAKVLP